MKVIFIGNYLRDFGYFYRVKVPQNLQKVLLIGEEDMEIEGPEAIKNGVEVLPRASPEDYEILLNNNLVFLSLTHEGVLPTHASD